MKDKDTPNQQNTLDLKEPWTNSFVYARKSISDKVNAFLRFFRISDERLFLILILGLCLSYIYRLYIYAEQKIDTEIGFVRFYSDLEKRLLALDEIILLLTGIFIFTLIAGWHTLSSKNTKEANTFNLNLYTVLILLLTAAVFKVLADYIL